jgi:glutaconate CoA-transferase subunit A
MPTSKFVTIEQALDLLPSQGCNLALGGVTLYRRPIYFSLALLKRFQQATNPDKIHLLSFTAGLESDVLVGAGMVQSIRSCYFGLESFGFAPHFTAAANQGELEIIEETEASLALGMRATISDVGFLPSKAWQGTDMFKLRPEVKSIADPYSGDTLTAFPALRCDVAVLHALEVDQDGNTYIGAHWGVDRELCLVANTVIVTTEKIVPELTQTDIIAPLVSAIVEAPGGAWPSSCHPLYPLDGEEYLRYTERAGTEEYMALLQEWFDHFGIA